jgi:glycosyltransferase involved in cell wall biosynthesis
VKALVVAPQPFFSPRGTPFSVYYRTLITAELGVEIDFLTYGEGEDVEIPGMRIIRIPRFAFLGKVKTGPSLLKLFLDVFMFLWTVGLLLANRYHFVHAHEEAVFFCRFLKPIFRFKLVYDMHSSLPQQLTNFQYTRSKLLIGLFKKLEDSSIKTANATITICPDLTEYARSIIPFEERLLQIENSIFEPIKIAQKESGQEYGSTNQKIQEKPIDLPEGKRFIVYAGTLEQYQGIEILINAFKYVMEEYPNPLLLIVGGTPAQVEHYRDMAEKNDLGQNVLFTGRVSQTLAKYYCGLASVLVSPRSEGTNTPLKIYEQIASGIPLVATNIYSHTQVLDDKIAFLVEPDPADMAGGILAALDPNGNRHLIAENAMKLYEQKYSRSIYKEKVIRMLEILSQDRKGDFEG